ncbi:hypothetical protein PSCICO_37980 [Pseudomonas cichorii]|uniref:Uncharacterized protein n=2 Tax=Pseudomonas syringae group TaxID=136849 RepID=A0A3M4VZE6_PSECI|nr:MULTISPECIES: hypothetical protein [Pseudomonas]MDO7925543.1 hypothetical protein [Pseudomonas sp. KFB-138]RMR56749.1 hypothetical protein ALP84_02926 [Pseudomonas cichorii]GFM77536.1 hypothetical protein PSCICM_33550 [Pseudomonas cichorii]GFM81203.1 hypothetical protein PSCICN_18950 [Pseudomonas cichorii]GFM88399.1 hypothetical protein PSCICO_37980 [Pseudomonas cichorii]
MNCYRSEGERQYLEHRKAELEKTIKAVALKNDSPVGEIKTYKGVQYQMNQRGNFLCINPRPELEGVFTTAFILHNVVDELERLKPKK